MSDLGNVEFPPRIPEQHELWAMLFVVVGRWHDAIMRHYVNAGLDLIESFEGLRLTAYPDPGSGGEPYTIGYGHTGSVNGQPVAPGMTITLDTADDLLQADLTPRGPTPGEKP